MKRSGQHHPKSSPSGMHSSSSLKTNDLPHTNQLKPTSSSVAVARYCGLARLASKLQSAIEQATNAMVMFLAIMSPRPFRWRDYIASHLTASVAIFLVSLFLDNVLHIFGVDISTWREAIYSALSGFLIATPIALLFWRIGLYTWPNYILGGVGLFVPITILSVIVISRFDNVLIGMSMSVSEEADFNQTLATTAYVRIARSAVLFPIYISVFWLIYHRCFKRAHMGADRKAAQNA